MCKSAEERRFSNTSTETGTRRRQTPAGLATGILSSSRDGARSCCRAAISRTSDVVDQQRHRQERLFPPTYSGKALFTPPRDYEGLVSRAGNQPGVQTCEPGEAAIAAVKVDLTHLAHAHAQPCLLFTCAHVYHACDDCRIDWCVGRVLASRRVLSVLHGA